VTRLRAVSCLAVQTLAAMPESLRRSTPTTSLVGRYSGAPNKRTRPQPTSSQRSEVGGQPWENCSAPGDSSVRHSVVRRRPRQTSVAFARVILRLLAYGTPRMNTFRSCRHDHDPRFTTLYSWKGEQSGASRRTVSSSLRVRKRCCPARGVGSPIAAGQSAGRSRCSR